MNSKQIANMIDHTILKATTTKEDVVKICNEAKEYGFFLSLYKSSKHRISKRRAKRKRC